MDWQGWNYGDLFDALADIIPAAQPALIFGDTVLPWGALQRRTNNVARALLAGGAQPGDKIAFYARNHPAYMEGVVAGLKARLTHVNVNYRYGAEEVRYILDNSDAAVVLFGRAFAPVVASVQPALPHVRRWLFIEDGSDETIPVFAEPFEPLAQQGDGERLPIARAPDDLILVYTGGTTGLPKGVMWTHDKLRRALVNPAPGTTAPVNMDEHLEQLRAAGPGPICLTACPLMHGTGLFTSLTALTGGGAVAMLAGQSFDAAELWQTVHDRRVAQLVIVGDAFTRPMLRVLDAAAGRYDLSCVSMVLSSGVMWSAEVRHALLRHTPQAVLVDSFGASEGVGFGFSITTAQGGAGTARFQIGDAVRVFTPEGRAVLPGSGEAGLIARGEPLPEGYYKDAAKTASTFRVVAGERYAIPGDYCTVDADGFITLLGRGSMCINTAGEKVFPEEVEEILKLHPDIEDALVVGVADEQWGQAVTAVVELRPGAVFDEAACRAHVRCRLAAYKAPKRVFAVARMFRTPNGKSDYQAARDMALRLLAHDSSGDKEMEGQERKAVLF
jgi:fatty-acyl-CoA synthase